MSPFRHPRVPRCAIAVILVTLVGSGCYAWRTVEATPSAIFAPERPAQVRVTVQDGGRHVVRRPLILADTLYGARGSELVAFALRDLARVEVHRPSPSRTAALFVLAGAAIAAYVTLRSCCPY